MSSYNVAGGLCDTRDEAARAIVFNWIWGIDTAETVAKLDPKAVLDEMKNAGIDFDAAVVGKYTEDGDPVYEDVAPTFARLREMIEETITDARAIVAHDRGTP